MIEKLEIKNFKSIERLELDCRRVNVFIGEPNTGKSNILEALGLISYVAHSDEWNELGDFVRYDHLANLFNRMNLDEPLEIVADGNFSLTLRHEIGRFTADVLWDDAPLSEGYTLSDASGSLKIESSCTDFGLSPGLAEEVGERFKFYRFASRATFPNKRAGFLAPPSGSNLLMILATNRDVAKLASLIYGLRDLILLRRQHADKLEVVRRQSLDEEFLVSHSDPYHLTSDTFQRLVFHLAAIRSNSDSYLIFEEPEAHVFPYHTKFLAEKVALDKRGNQFFITTHNPYFLLPLIEKTPESEIAVFITTYKDYRTQVTEMAGDDLSVIMDTIDVFSNIDLFVDGR